MDVKQMQPVTCIDWDAVSFVRVTLEKPYKGGGFQRRLGTTTPKKNLGYNAHDPTSGPPYFPGVPILYPDEKEPPAIAGDPERDSFLMPAQAAYTWFGHFFAPLTVPSRGIIGFTISDEKSRVTAMWSGYKMPHGNGTMHPSMARIGPPDVPHVALRPLDRSFQPIKVDGEELVIRPREFFDFDNAASYERPPEVEANEVASMLQGFTPDEIAGLRELVKVKRGSAKG